MRSIAKRAESVLVLKVYLFTKNSTPTEENKRIIEEAIALISILLDD